MTELVDAVVAQMARQRLDRLARLNAQYGHQLNARGIRLLRHAAFEAYITLKDLEDTMDERGHDLVPPGVS